jgi:hypothetical protein
MLEARSRPGSTRILHMSKDLKPTGKCTQVRYLTSSRAEVGKVVKMTATGAVNEFIKTGTFVRYY